MGCTRMPKSRMKLEKRKTIAEQEVCPVPKVDRVLSRGQNKTREHLIIICTSRKNASWRVQLLQHSSSSCATCLQPLERLALFQRQVAESRQRSSCLGNSPPAGGTNKVPLTTPLKLPVMNSQRAQRWEKDLHVLGAYLPFNGVASTGTARLHSCYAMIQVASSRFFLSSKSSMPGKVLHCQVHSFNPRAVDANPVEIFFDGFHGLAVRSFAHDPSRNLTQILVHAMLADCRLVLSTRLRCQTMQKTKTS